MREGVTLRYIKKAGDEWGSMHGPSVALDYIVNYIYKEQNATRSYSQQLKAVFDGYWSQTFFVLWTNEKGRGPSLLAFVDDFLKTKCDIKTTVIRERSGGDNATEHRFGPRRFNSKNDHISLSDVT